MRNSKGVSPLIASIILIGFVIAVAAITSPWFKSITKSKMYEVEESSKGQIDCVFSSIDFDSSDISYNLSGTTDWVNITLDNTGTVPLYDFEVSLTVNGVTKVYSPTSYSQKTSSDPLEAGGRIILITNITDGLSGTLQKVRVVAKNCPNEAQKEVTL
ncbi:MAG: hypothetical protein J7K87_03750 [Candidatus Aenigmarchaeota archaeon]|nr:hypothetical protein [Candidatus Aenigmarchaeota archaeon]